MKAEVIVHLDVADLAEAAGEGEALRLARRVAQRVGTPGSAEVMSSLFDDGYRVRFVVDPIGAEAK